MHQGVALGVVFGLVPALLVTSCSGGNASEKGVEAGVGSDAAVLDDAGDGSAANAAGFSDASAPDAGTGAVAVLGHPCGSPAALACAGNASKVPLICSGTPLTWTQNGTCAYGELCDSRPGVNQGTCAPVDPVCVGQSPGAAVCADDTHVALCGPDLVSHAVTDTCSGDTNTTGCQSGACVCPAGSASCTSAGALIRCMPNAGTQTIPCATGSCSDGACAGETPSAPSCRGAFAFACGNEQADSCCASIEVPAGRYDQDYVNLGDGGVFESAPAQITGFRLDKYLVTVNRYRQFVAAWTKGWRPAQGSGVHDYLVHPGGPAGLAAEVPPGGVGLAADGGAAAYVGPAYETGWLASYVSSTFPQQDVQCGALATWTPSAGNNERLPINCASWYDAYAFCIWDSGFLPSAAEWEYVAAGGDEQLEYPWGSVAPGTACPGTGCEYAIYNCDYPNGSGNCAPSSANIAPVGTASLGAGRWGHLDLAGNLSQWAYDWSGPLASTCVDCAVLQPPADQSAYGYGRMSWGGDFSAPAVMLGVRGLGVQDPSTVSPYTGIRCARDP